MCYNITILKRLWGNICSFKLTAWKRAIFPTLKANNSCKFIIVESKSEMGKPWIDYLHSCNITSPIHYWWEEFEDTKGVIKIRKSKNRQHNDQKKEYKRTNNDLLTEYQISLKIHKIEELQIPDIFLCMSGAMARTPNVVVILCSMIWCERWLFVLLILIKLL